MSEHNLFKYLVACEIIYLLIVASPSVIHSYKAVHISSNMVRYLIAIVKMLMPTTLDL